MRIYKIRVSSETWRGLILKRPQEGWQQPVKSYAYAFCVLGPQQESQLAPNADSTTREEAKQSRLSGSKLSSQDKVWTEAEPYPVSLMTHSEVCIDPALVRTANSPVSEGGSNYRAPRASAIARRRTKGMKRIGLIPQRMLNKQELVTKAGD